MLPFTRLGVIPNHLGYRKNPHCPLTICGRRGNRPICQHVGRHLDPLRASVFLFFRQLILNISDSSFVGSPVTRPDWLHSDRLLLRVALELPCHSRRPPGEFRPDALPHSGLGWFRLPITPGGRIPRKRILEGRRGKKQLSLFQILFLIFVPALVVTAMQRETCNWAKFPFFSHSFPFSTCPQLSLSQLRPKTRSVDMHRSRKFPNFVRRFVPNTHKRKRQLRNW